MTALNLITSPKTAYLVADRASCWADGVIGRIDPKIFVASRLHVAIGMTGLSAAGSHLCAGAWLAAQSSQLGIMTGLPGLLRELVALNDIELAKPGAGLSVGGMPQVVTLAVAIWSIERRQADGCLMTSARGHLPDRVPPFKLWPANRYIQPEVPAEFHPAPGEVSDAQALALIDAQRAVPSPWGTLHIGGGADIAVVDANGAQLRELCTWPDHVGSVIGSKSPRRRLKLFGRSR